MQHTHVSSEQQVASLKITEGNPAQDPSQNQMGRPVFIRTTNIQATGCNLRVSKETTEFDDVIFFNIRWVLWDYSQLLARVVMQTSPLTGMKIASSRFNFDVGAI